VDDSRGRQTRHLLLPLLHDFFKEIKIEEKQGIY
jgi:hypothetical protein